MTKRPLDIRKRKAMRTAKTKAETKYSIGGILKKQHAAKPVTLARTSFETNGKGE